MGGVVVAAAAAICLYLLVHVESPERPMDHGRNWFAWVSAFGTIAVLAPLTGDAFARWIIMIVFFGGFAFIGGLLWGSFGVRHQNESSEVPKRVPRADDNEGPVQPSDRNVLSPDVAANIPSSVEKRLVALKLLHEKDLVSDEEFAKKRKEILDSL